MSILMYVMEDLAGLSSMCPIGWFGHCIIVIYLTLVTFVYIICDKKQQYIPDGVVTSLLDYCGTRLLTAIKHRYSLIVIIIIMNIIVSSFLYREDINQHWLTDQTADLFNEVSTDDKIKNNVKSGFPGRKNIVVIWRLSTIKMWRKIRYHLCFW